MSKDKEREKIKRDCFNALSTARLAIRKEFPYYSTVTYGFIPRIAHGYGTLGVTPGMVLIIDPVWYLALEKEIPDDVTSPVRSTERRSRTDR